MKRIFALITTVALVIGMVPVTYASGQTGGYEYLFNLSSHEHAQSDESDIRNGDFETDNMSATAESAPWGFVNHSGNCSGEISSTVLKWEIDDAAFENGAAIGFELSVDKAGKYSPVLKGKASGNGVKANAYLLRKPADAALWFYSSDNEEVSYESFMVNAKKITSYYCLGEVDFYGVDADASVKQSFETLDIKNAGEYFLVLVLSGKNEGAVSDDNIWTAELVSFALNEVPANTAHEKEFDPAAAYKFKNPNDTLTVSASDGIFTATNIQVRFYGYGVPNAPLAVFGVQVDKSGTYNINFKTDENAPINSAAPAVYVIEDDGTYTGNTQASTLLGNNSPFGYFNFSTLKASDGYVAVTSDGKSQSDLSSVYLDAAKKYLIVMYMDAASFYLNDVADTGDLGNKGYSPAEGGGIKTASGTSLGKSNYQVIRISGIAFTPAADVPGKVIPAPAIESAKLTVAKEQIFVGGSAETEISVMGEKDKPWLYDYETVYKTSNNNVSVNSNGTVTALAKGNTEVWAEITVDGKTVTTNRIEIEVLPVPVLSKLVISSDKPQVEAGVSAKLTVSGVLTDGTMADMSRYEVLLTSSNPEVATISSDGKVDTYKEGLAVITARAINEDGNEIICKYSFNVGAVSENVVINFMETTLNSDLSAPGSHQTPGYEIVMAESDTTYWNTSNSNNTDSIKFIYSGATGPVWPGADANAKSGVTLLVNIPIEQDYRIVYRGAKWKNGGVFHIFVDDQYVGDYNGFDATSEKIVDCGEFVFNTVHLTPGPHKLVFKKSEQVCFRGALFLNEIRFEAVAESGTEYKGFSAEIPSELAIGEIFAGEAFAEMSDGSLLYFGVNAHGEENLETKAILETDADKTLDVFVGNTIGNKGKIPYRIEGLAVGSASVTYGMMINGEPHTETKTVKVEKLDLASVRFSETQKTLFCGATAEISAEAFLENERVLGEKSAPITYNSMNDKIVTVDGNVLTGIKSGKTQIKASASFNGITVDTYLDVEVVDEGIAEIEITSGGSDKIRLSDNSADRYPLLVSAKTNLGNDVDMSSVEIKAEAMTTDIAKIAYESYPDASSAPAYYIEPLKEGVAKFSVQIKLPSETITKEVEIPVVPAKTKATLFPEERRNIAIENVSKYSWAKSSAQTQISRADKYVGLEEQIYNLFPSQEIPRSMTVGAEGDPEMYYCRYCGVDLQSEYANFPWIHNPLQRAWKIQCPDCKRLFPSNDFESFYKLGLNEYGEFIYQDALDEHRRLFGDKTIDEPGTKHSEQWKKYYGYGVPGGYLTNILYDDLEDNKTINCGRGLRAGETVETWGVDDGYGYVPSMPDGTPYGYTVDKKFITERHLYIAEYAHSALWRYQNGDGGGMLTHAIDSNANAYYYTGDIRYGRTAAVLLDRLADFFPDYNIKVFGDDVWNSDGGSNLGKREGRIWETGLVMNNVRSYDKIFELYEDPYVLSFIQNKACKYKMRSSKQTPSQIRQHIEDRLIRESLECVRRYEVFGNFGPAQQVTAICAIVLDSDDETKHWIEYLNKPGWKNVKPLATGGGINEILFSTTDADGMSDEASEYGTIWLDGLIDVSESLSYYKGSADLEKIKFTNNPKYKQMFYGLLPVYAAKSYSAQIGDSGTTAGNSHWMDSAIALQGYIETKDPIFAQFMYMLNGDKTEGLHYSIDTENPESIKREVSDIIEKYGPLDLKSDIMTHFGYAILRDGKNFSSNVTTPTADDTTRNAWLYFGGAATSHGHEDSLNLGITAFGLNFLPDLGYPEKTGEDPNRNQWVSNTLSHNTVVVNEKMQKENSEIHGKVKHYDDTDNVKVIDVSTKYSYEDENVDEYRRAVVMINVDDKNSYYVDLFRILGGRSHIYSLHAQSNEITETQGLSLVPQVDENGKYVGTYAGKNSTFGNDEGGLYPIGYTWLDNVDRDENPQDKIEVNFKIKDFNRAIANSDGLGLYVTMLNGTNTEMGADVNVAIADGYPPDKAENKKIDKLKYVLVENEGKNLDTVFTTVYEPYRGNRSLSDAEELQMTKISGTGRPGDASRAVKITHEDGRVDYVFYATNNNILYTVTDGERMLNFRGAIGVYTVENGKNTYDYVLDGDIIGETTGKSASIEGIVTGFTKTLEEKNEIRLRPSESVSAEEIASLANKVVIIDNGETTRSGTFKIISASPDSDDIVLDVGRITPIRKFVDMYNESAGYVYTIAEGQEARIPLSWENDFSPRFDAMENVYTASAENRFSITVKAESDVEDTTLTYALTNAPRGASIDSDTGEISWKPDSSQVGNNHFAVTARDSDGRETTTHFTVTVYGSTTGSKPSTDNDMSVDNSGDTTAPSGGGGGGGAAPTDQKDNAEDSSTDVGGSDFDDPQDNVENSETSPDASGETDDIRFTDLSNHAWAADAINELAQNGIIRGTTSDTYSPANNITRADFASLLVRAFELKSDNTENFADVSASDYFAKELAIARSNGIIGGIGDNKFAPRNTITRQDMMVIVYRALQALNVGLGDCDEPQYEDFTTVADYAKTAVSSLIGAGLVNGKSGHIAPADYTTRAEVAVLIKRILDYVK